MRYRPFIALGAAAIAALYACTDAATDEREQGLAGSGSGSGPGSGSHFTFSVWHYANNLRDAAAVNARLDLLLADDLGGLGALGYGGCELDPSTVWRSTYLGPIQIGYEVEGAPGSFSAPGPVMPPVVDEVTIY
jgi:hypothetical protein